MRKRVVAAGSVAAVLGAVYLMNASWLAKPPAGRPEVLAHRGIHQTFSIEGLKRDGCTASRIDPPTNPYLENTIPSMKASFAVGADALELDIHPTTDGEFAVFHDWTLECRTNGQGVTRDQTMRHLKTLDIGYGYTADNGATYPFRGKGVGSMPTLDEVLKAFPGKTFLINIKSRDPTEGERLYDYLKTRGHPTDRRLWVVAHDLALTRLTALAPEARLWSTNRAKTCVVRYIALGWSGYVPAACKGAALGAPLNYAWAYWGWPNRLLDRMNRAGVDVALVGPTYRGDVGMRGLETKDDLDAVPEGFNGTLVTDAIDVIAPEARRRWPDSHPVR